MPTAIDPEEILRLYGALKERILAKDAEGTVRVYEELLRLGQPLSEIIAQGARVLDGPPAGPPDFPSEAFAGGTDATVRDEPPSPDSLRFKPTPERVVERTWASLAGRHGVSPDWAIDAAAPGEASPIAGDTETAAPGEALPVGGDTAASVAPVARPASRRGAMTPLSPIALLGFAACAIAAVAGIGALLLHPAAQKVTPGGPPAREAAVDVRAGTSPAVDAAATPSAEDAAASDAATGRVSTAEPGSAPATSADAPPPPAEPAPSVQPVHDATQPEVATTATVPPTVAEPAEPVPAVRPAPPAPALEAPSSAAAPAPKPPPDRPHLAAADIAALLARGDSLLGVGDIASARLFYERASDVGEGRAALRLGATYDPGFVDQVHLPHLNGDVAQALSWYRRARDLGESEAERWIQALESKSGR
jgi:hypothetical protein